MPAMNREQPRDTSLGKVTFWSKDGKLPAVVRDLIDDRVPREIHNHTDGTGGAAITVAGIQGEATPNSNPFYIFYVHGGQDNAKVQRDAGRVGAPHGAICLPAAAGWLTEKLAKLTQIDRRDVTVVVRGGAY